jgi:hypothetical protein
VRKHGSGRDMTTKRLTELDQRASQLEQRMAELRDELAGRGGGVIRKVMDDAAGAPEASAQGVTLRIPTHMAAPSHALVLRGGLKPTRPRGRIPRVARLLALAHHFQELLDTGAIETQAELAELAKLTPERVTKS